MPCSITASGSASQWARCAKSGLAKQGASVVLAVDVRHGYCTRACVDGSQAAVVNAESELVRASEDRQVVNQIHLTLIIGRVLADGERDVAAEAEAIE